MVEKIIGENKCLRTAMEDAVKIATSKAPVLLLGETGTGKELFANLIHNKSKRRNAPHIKVNCAAIQDALLESDLFGHVKGAFTGASNSKIGKLQAADTGTIFLDEVSNMSLPIQAKVLRALEYQQFEQVGGTKTISVDVRIISASNQSIEHLINEGLFRKDLFYRLGVMAISIPPLRERKSDIILLSQHFAKQFKAIYEKNITTISNTATKLLQAYNWPGNIRELKNVIERAVIFCNGAIITDKHIHIKGFHQVVEIDDIYFDDHEAGYIVSRLSGNGYKHDMEGAIQYIEKAWILRSLESNKFVQKEAAKDLGISPRVLCYKMQKHGIESESPHKKTKGV